LTAGLLAACGGGGGDGGSTGGSGGAADAGPDLDATGGAPAPAADLGPGPTGGADGEPEDARRPRRDRGMGGDPTPADAEVDAAAATCADEVDLSSAAVADAENARWIYTGSSRGAAQANAGSCGGNGRELVFLFTAPEFGQYGFRTRDPDGVPNFDAVLYARRACEDPASELGCDNAPDAPDASLRLQMNAGEIVHVFVDAFGPFTGGDFELEVSLRRPAAEGQPCDLADGENACGENLVCLSVDESFRCRPLVAPTVEAATLAFNPDFGALGLRVSGTDPGNDVVAVALTARDAEGGEVPLGVGDDRQAFDALQQGEGAFEGEVRLRVPRDLPPVAEITLEVVDAAGLRSEPLVLAAVAPEARAAGEACDTSRTFDACAPGLVCDDAACGDAPAACPAAFGARRLPVDEITDGDLLGAADVAAGTCGGAGGDAVFTFTAAETGLHVFEAWGDAFNAAPLLFARDLCGVEDVVVARDCALPNRDRRARIAFELSAGETVSLFVDSADAAWAGEFHLRGWHPAPPTLTSAALFANADASVLGFQVEGGDPDLDVRALGVRLFDADGADLLGEAGPVDLALEAGELTFPRPGRVSVRAVRLVGLDATEIAAVEVGLVDAFGGRSAVRRLVPEPTPVVARGEVCDLEEAFAACTPPDRCRAGAGGGADPDGTCQEVRDDCPPEFGEVVDASGPDFRTGDTSWAYSGDTSLRIDQASGSCGAAGGSEEPVRFEAPLAGLYVFRTAVGDGRDTVLYARSQCGEAAPEAELGCNDDAPGGGTLNSELTLALDAGQVVYVFVDGFGGGFGGPFTLTIEVL
jgi:hypothetical protein